MTALGFIDDVNTAVLALLRADEALHVIDGQAPDGTRPPYLVVYLTTDYEHGRSVDGATDWAAWRITTHSVGATATAARVVSGRARAQLLDQRPTVAGYQSWRIRHDASPNTVEDERQVVTEFDLIDVWTFTTAPATAGVL